MIPILPLLSVMSLSNHLQRNSYHSEEQQKQNKKQFLTKLKYKPMLVKVKVNYGGDDDWKEQLINLSMIREVRQGWGDGLMYGLKKDEWCIVEFIDGSSLYVETTLDDTLAKLWDIQDKEINVVTRERRTGRGPY